MARIELKVGTFEFAAEGDEKWVAEQLKAASAQFEQFAKIAPKAAAPSTGTAKSNPHEEEAGPLATHLKSHGAEKSQNRKFLATADWLRRKGEKTITTAKVTGALKDNQQKRLGNAAQCLNNNVGQGLCEKDGSGFYITGEGLKELGYEV